MAVPARWPHCRSVVLSVCVESGEEASFWQPIRELADAGALRKVHALVFSADTWRRDALSACSDSDYSDVESDESMADEGAWSDDYSQGSGDLDYQMQPYQLTADAADALIRLLPALEDLTFDHSLRLKLTDLGAIYGCLARATHLRRLQMPGRMYDDDGIAQLQGLTELDLRNVYSLRRPPALHGMLPQGQQQGLPQALLQNPPAHLHELVDLPQHLDEDAMGLEDLGAQLFMAQALGGALDGPAVNIDAAGAAGAAEAGGAAADAFLPGLRSLPKLSALSLEGSLTEPMTPRQLLDALPSGLKTLRATTFGVVIPRLLGGPEPQWAEALSRWVSEMWQGDFRLDFVAARLELGKVTSPKTLAELVYGFTKTGSVRTVAVQELTLVPEQGALSGADTGVCAAAATYLSSFAAQRHVLDIRAGVCGFKAGRQLPGLLRGGCPVKRLVLHAHGSNDSNRLVELVQSLAREVPAEQLPQQLCISGYLRSPESLRAALAGWPPLQVLVALVHFEERVTPPPPTTWLRRSASSGRSGQSEKPQPRRYAEVLRMVAGKVREGGWCAVPCRTDEGFEAGLMEELRREEPLTFPVRVVEHRSRRWACAAASEDVLVAACKEVCEFTQ